MQRIGAKRVISEGRTTSTSDDDEEEDEDDENGDRDDDENGASSSDSEKNQNNTDSSRVDEDEDDVRTTTRSGRSTGSRESYVDRDSYRHSYRMESATLQPHQQQPLAAPQQQQHHQQPSPSSMNFTGILSDSSGGNGQPANSFGKKLKNDLQDFETVTPQQAWS